MAASEKIFFGVAMDFFNCIFEDINCGRGEIYPSGHKLLTLFILFASLRFAAEGVRFELTARLRGRQFSRLLP